MALLAAAAHSKRFSRSPSQSASTGAVEQQRLQTSYGGERERHRAASPARTHSSAYFTSAPRRQQRRTSPDSYSRLSDKHRRASHISRSLSDAAAASPRSSAAADVRQQRYASRLGPSDALFSATVASSHRRVAPKSKERQRKPSDAIAFHHKGSSAPDGLFYEKQQLPSAAGSFSNRNEHNREGEPRDNHSHSSRPSRSPHHSSTGSTAAAGRRWHSNSGRRTARDYYKSETERRGREASSSSSSSPSPRLKSYFHQCSTRSARERRRGREAEAVAEGSRGGSSRNARSSSAHRRGGSNRYRRHGTYGSGSRRGRSSSRQDNSSSRGGSFKRRDGSRRRESSNSRATREQYVEPWPSNGARHTGKTAEERAAAARAAADGAAAAGAAVLFVGGGRSGGTHRDTVLPTVAVKSSSISSVPLSKGGGVSSSHHYANVTAPVSSHHSRNPFSFRRGASSSGKEKKADASAVESRPSSTTKPSSAARVEAHAPADYRGGSSATRRRYSRSFSPSKQDVAPAGGDATHPASLLKAAAAILRQQPSQQQHQPRKSRWRLSRSSSPCGKREANRSASPRSAFTAAAARGERSKTADCKHPRRSDSSSPHREERPVSHGTHSPFSFLFRRRREKPPLCVMRSTSSNCSPRHHQQQSKACNSSPTKKPRSRDCQSSDRNAREYRSSPNTGTRHHPLISAGKPVAGAVKGLTHSCSIEGLARSRSSSTSHGSGSPPCREKGCLRQCRVPRSNTFEQQSHCNNRSSKRTSCFDVFDYTVPSKLPPTLNAESGNCGRVRQAQLHKHSTSDAFIPNTSDSQRIPCCSAEGQPSAVGALLEGQQPFFLNSRLKSDVSGSSSMCHELLLQQPPNGGKRLNTPRVRREPLADAGFSPCEPCCSPPLVTSGTAADHQTAATVAAAIAASFDRRAFSSSSNCCGNLSCGSCRARSPRSTCPCSTNPSSGGLSCPPPATSAAAATSRATARVSPNRCTLKEGFQLSQREPRLGSYAAASSEAIEQSLPSHSSCLQQSTLSSCGQWHSDPPPARSTLRRSNSDSLHFFCGSSSRRRASAAVAATDRRGEPLLRGGHRVNTLCAAIGGCPCHDIGAAAVAAGSSCSGGRAAFLRAVATAEHSAALASCAAAETQRSFRCERAAAAAAAAASRRHRLLQQQQQQQHHEGDHLNRSLCSSRPHGDTYAPVSSLCVDAGQLSKYPAGASSADTPCFAAGTCTAATAAAVRRQARPGKMDEASLRFLRSSSTDHAAAGCASAPPCDLLPSSSSSRLGEERERLLLCDTRHTSSSSLEKFREPRRGNPKWLRGCDGVSDEGLLSAEGIAGAVTTADPLRPQRSMPSDATALKEELTSFLACESASPQNTEALGGGETYLKRSSAGAGNIKYKHNHSFSCLTRSGSSRCLASPHYLRGCATGSLPAEFFAREGNASLHVGATSLVPGAVLPRLASVCSAAGSSCCGCAANSTAAASRLRSSSFSSSWSSTASSAHPAALSVNVSIAERNMQERLQQIASQENIEKQGLCSHSFSTCDSSSSNCVRLRSGKSSAFAPSTRLLQSLTALSPLSLKRSEGLAAAAAAAEKVQAAARREEAKISRPFASVRQHMHRENPMLDFNLSAYGTSSGATTSEACCISCTGSSSRSFPPEAVAAECCSSSTRDLPRCGSQELKTTSKAHEFSHLTKRLEGMQYSAPRRSTSAVLLQQLQRHQVGSPTAYAHFTKHCTFADAIVTSSKRMKGPACLRSSTARPLATDAAGDAISADTSAGTSAAATIGACATGESKALAERHTPAASALAQTVAASAAYEDIGRTLATEAAAAATPTRKNTSGLAAAVAVRVPDVSTKDDRHVAVAPAAPASRETAAVPSFAVGSSGECSTTAPAAALGATTERTATQETAAALSETSPTMGGDASSHTRPVKGTAVHAHRLATSLRGAADRECTASPCSAAAVFRCGVAAVAAEILDVSANSLAVTAVAPTSSDTASLSKAQRQKCRRICRLHRVLCHSLKAGHLAVAASVAASTVAAAPESRRNEAATANGDGAVAATPRAPSVASTWVRTYGRETQEKQKHLVQQPRQQHQKPHQSEHKQQGDLMEHQQMLRQAHHERRRGKQQLQQEQNGQHLIHQDLKSLKGRPVVSAGNSAAETSALAAQIKHGAGCIYHPCELLLSSSADKAHALRLERPSTLEGGLQQQQQKQPPQQLHHWLKHHLKPQPQQNELEQHCTREQLLQLHQRQHLQQCTAVHQQVMQRHFAVREQLLTSATEEKNQALEIVQQRMQETSAAVSDAVMLHRQNKCHSATVAPSHPQQQQELPKRTNGVLHHQQAGGRGEKGMPGHQQDSESRRAALLQQQKSEEPKEAACQPQRKEGQSDGSLLHHQHRGDQAADNFLPGCLQQCHCVGGASPVQALKKHHPPLSGEELLSREPLLVAAEASTATSATVGKGTSSRSAAIAASASRHYPPSAFPGVPATEGLLSLSSSFPSTSSPPPSSSSSATTTVASSSAAPVAGASLRALSSHFVAAPGAAHCSRIGNAPPAAADGQLPVRHPHPAASDMKVVAAGAAAVKTPTLTAVEAATAAVATSAATATAAAPAKTATPPGEQDADSPAAAYRDTNDEEIDRLEGKSVEQILFQAGLRPLAFTVTPAATYHAFYGRAESTAVASSHFTAASEGPAAAPGKVPVVAATRPISMVISAAADSVSDNAGASPAALVTGDSVENPYSGSGASCCTTAEVENFATATSKSSIPAATLPAANTNSAKTLERSPAGAGPTPTAAAARTPATEITPAVAASHSAASACEIASSFVAGCPPAASEDMRHSPPAGVYPNSASAASTAAVVAPDATCPAVPETSAAAAAVSAAAPRVTAAAALSTTTAPSSASISFLCGAAGAASTATVLPAMTQTVAGSATPNFVATGALGVSVGMATASGAAQEIVAAAADVSCLPQEQADFTSAAKADRQQQQQLPCITPVSVPAAEEEHGWISTLPESAAVSEKGAATAADARLGTPPHVHVAAAVGASVANLDAEACPQAAPPVHRGVAVGAAGANPGAEAHPATSPHEDKGVAAGAVVDNYGAHTPLATVAKAGAAAVRKSALLRAADPRMCESADRRTVDAQQSKQEQQQRCDSSPLPTRGEDGAQQQQQKGEIPFNAQYGVKRRNGSRSGNSDSSCSRRSSRYHISNSSNERDCTSRSRDGSRSSWATAQAEETTRDGLNRTSTSSGSAVSPTADAIAWLVPFSRSNSSTKGMQRECRSRSAYQQSNISCNNSTVCPSHSSSSGRMRNEELTGSCSTYLHQSLLFSSSSTIYSQENKCGRSEIEGQQHSSSNSSHTDVCHCRTLSGAAAPLLEYSNSSSSSSQKCEERTTLQPRLSSSRAAEQAPRMRTGGNARVIASSDAAIKRENNAQTEKKKSVGSTKEEYTCKRTVAKAGGRSKINSLQPQCNSLRSAVAAAAAASATVGEVLHAIEAMRSDSFRLSRRSSLPAASSKRRSRRTSSRSNDRDGDNSSESASNGGASPSDASNTSSWSSTEREYTRGRNALDATSGKVSNSRRRRRWTTRRGEEIDTLRALQSDRLCAFDVARRRPREKRKQQRKKQLQQVLSCWGHETGREDRPEEDLQEQLSITNAEDLRLLQQTSGETFEQLERLFALAAAVEEEEAGNDSPSFFGTSLPRSRAPSAAVAAAAGYAAYCGSSSNSCCFCIHHHHQLPAATAGEGPSTEFFLPARRCGCLAVSAAAAASPAAAAPSSFSSALTFIGIDVRSSHLLNASDRKAAPATLCPSSSHVSMQGLAHQREATHHIDDQENKQTPEAAQQKLRMKTHPQQDMQQEQQQHVQQRQQDAQQNRQQLRQTDTHQQQQDMQEEQQQDVQQREATHHIHDQETKQTPEAAQQKLRMKTHPQQDMQEEQQQHVQHRQQDAQQNRQQLHPTGTHPQQPDTQQEQEQEVQQRHRDTLSQQDREQLHPTGTHPQQQDMQEEQQQDVQHRQQDTISQQDRQQSHPTGTHQQQQDMQPEQHEESRKPKKRVLRGCLQEQCCVLQHENVGESGKLQQLYRHQHQTKAKNQEQVEQQTALQRQEHTNGEGAGRLRKQQKALEDVEAATKQQQEQLHHRLPQHCPVQEKAMPQSLGLGQHEQRFEAVLSDETAELASSLGGAADGEQPQQQVLQHPGLQQEEDRGVEHQEQHDPQQRPQQSKHLRHRCRKKQCVADEEERHEPSISLEQDRRRAEQSDPQHNALGELLHGVTELPGDNKQQETYAGQYVRMLSRPVIHRAQYETAPAQEEGTATSSSLFTCHVAQQDHRVGSATEDSATQGIHSASAASAAAATLSVCERNTEDYHQQEEHYVEHRQQQERQQLQEERQHRHGEPHQQQIWKDQQQLGQQIRQSRRERRQNVRLLEPQQRGHWQLNGHQQKKPENILRVLVEYESFPRPAGVTGQAACKKFEPETGAETPAALLSEPSHWFPANEVDAAPHIKKTRAQGKCPRIAACEDVRNAGVVSPPRNQQQETQLPGGQPEQQQEQPQKQSQELSQFSSLPSPLSLPSYSPAQSEFTFASPELHDESSAAAAELLEAASSAATGSTAAASSAATVKPFETQARPYDAAATNAGSTAAAAETHRSSEACTPARHAATAAASAAAGCEAAPEANSATTAPPRVEVPSTAAAAPRESFGLQLHQYWSAGADTTSTASLPSRRGCRNNAPRREEVSVDFAGETSHFSSPSCDPTDRHAAAAHLQEDRVVVTASAFPQGLRKVSDTAKVAAVPSAVVSTIHSSGRAPVTAPPPETAVSEAATTTRAEAAAAGDDQSAREHASAPYQTTGKCATANVTSPAAGPRGLSTIVITAADSVSHVVQRSPAATARALGEAEGELTFSSPERYKYGNRRLCRGYSCNSREETGSTRSRTGSSTSRSRDRREPCNSSRERLHSTLVSRNGRQTRSAVRSNYRNANNSHSDGKGTPVMSSSAEEENIAQITSRQKGINSSNSSNARRTYQSPSSSTVFPVSFAGARNAAGVVPPDHRLSDTAELRTSVFVLPSATAASSGGGMATANPKSAAGKAHVETIVGAATRGHLENVEEANTALTEWKSFAGCPYKQSTPRSAAEEHGLSLSACRYPFPGTPQWRRVLRASPSRNGSSTNKKNDKSSNNRSSSNGRKGSKGKTLRHVLAAWRKCPLRSMMVRFSSGGCAWEAGGASATTNNLCVGSRGGAVTVRHQQHCSSRTATTAVTSPSARCQCPSRSCSIQTGNPTRAAITNITALFADRRIKEIYTVVPGAATTPERGNWCNAAENNTCTGGKCARRPERAAEPEGSSKTNSKGGYSSQRNSSKSNMQKRPSGCLRSTEQSNSNSHSNGDSSSNDGRTLSYRDGDNCTAGCRNRPYKRCGRSTTTDHRGSWLSWSRIRVPCKDCSDTSSCYSGRSRGRCHHPRAQASNQQRCGSWNRDVSPCASCSSTTSRSSESFCNLRDTEQQDFRNSEPSSFSNAERREGPVLQTKEETLKTDVIAPYQEDTHAAVSLEHQQRKSPRNSSMANRSGSTSSSSSRKLLRPPLSAADTLRSIFCPGEHHQQPGFLPQHHQDEEQQEKDEPQQPADSTESYSLVRRHSPYVPQEEQQQLEPPRLSALQRQCGMEQLQQSEHEQQRQQPTQQLQHPRLQQQPVEQVRQHCRWQLTQTPQQQARQRHRTQLHPEQYKHCTDLALPSFAKTSPPPAASLCTPSDCPPLSLETVPSFTGGTVDVSAPAFLPASSSRSDPQRPPSSGTSPVACRATLAARGGAEEPANLKKISVSRLFGVEGHQTVTLPGTCVPRESTQRMTPPQQQRPQHCEVPLSPQTQVASREAKQQHQEHEGGSLGPQQKWPQWSCQQQQARPYQQHLAVNQAQQRWHNVLKCQREQHKESCVADKQQQQQRHEQLQHQQIKAAGSAFCAVTPQSEGRQVTLRVSKELCGNGVNQPMPLQQQQRWPQTCAQKRSAAAPRNPSAVAPYFAATPNLHLVSSSFERREKAFTENAVASLDSLGSAAAAAPDAVRVSVVAVPPGALTAVLPSAANFPTAAAYPSVKGPAGAAVGDAVDTAAFVPTNNPGAVPQTFPAEKLVAATSAAGKDRIVVSHNTKGLEQKQHHQPRVKQAQSWIRPNSCSALLGQVKRVDEKQQHASAHLFSSLWVQQKQQGITQIRRPPQLRVAGQPMGHTTAKQPVAVYPFCKRRAASAVAVDFTRSSSGRYAFCSTPHSEYSSRGFAGCSNPNNCSTAKNSYPSANSLPGNSGCYEPCSSSDSLSGSKGFSIGSPAGSPFPLRHCSPAAAAVLRRPLDASLQQIPKSLQLLHVLQQQQHQENGVLLSMQSSLNFSLAASATQKKQHQQRQAQTERSSSGPPLLQRPRPSSSCVFSRSESNRGSLSHTQDSMKVVEWYLQSRNLQQQLQQISKGQLVEGRTAQNSTQDPSSASVKTH